MKVFKVISRHDEQIAEIEIPVKHWLSFSRAGWAGCPEFALQVVRDAESGPSTLISSVHLAAIAHRDMGRIHDRRVESSSLQTTGEAADRLALSSC